MSTVAFLGLGIMGRGMAGNLLAAGHDVRVWNRTPGRETDLVELGASSAASPREAIAGVDVVMYCLSDDAAVDDLVLGDGGLCGSVAADTIVVDLSTVAPETAVAEHEAFGARGVRFLDAPVFGSRGEAAAGGLWIVVGGDRDTFEAARPVLEPISETLHYMGEAGNGARMKLVGNLLVASQLASLGEALTLAKKAGLGLRDVLGVLSVTDFRTPIYDGVGAAVLADDYSTNFALHLMRKDARLIGAFASSLGIDLPTTEAAVGIIERAVEDGYGSENASALIRVLAADAGVDLAE